MVRTFIQVTALLHTFISAFFLIKGIIEMKSKDIAELSRPNWDSNPARNLTKQKADTVVGFVFLMLSFSLSLANLLWPMRWSDFGINSYGLIIAVLICIVLFLGAYKASNILQQHYYHQVENILNEPNAITEQPTSKNFHRHSDTGEIYAIENLCSGGIVGSVGPLSEPLKKPNEYEYNTELNDWITSESGKLILV